MAHRLRPATASPIRALGGEDVVDGPQLERPALLGAPGGEGVGGRTRGSTRRRRGPRTSGARTRRRSTIASRFRARPARAEPPRRRTSGHLLDPQVDRVPPAARAREVRARIRVGTGIRRVQRADRQESRADARRPGGELAEVAEIADPPRSRRPRGSQLHGPAPLAQASRQVAAAGAGDAAFGRVHRRASGGDSRMARRAARTRPARATCRPRGPGRRWPGSRAPRGGDRARVPGSACRPDRGQDRRSRAGRDGLDATRCVAVGRRDELRRVRPVEHVARAADAAGRRPSARRRGRWRRRRARRAPR